MYVILLVCVVIPSFVQQCIDQPVANLLIMVS